MSDQTHNKKEIIMYTVEGCPFCRRAKELFGRLKVIFTEYEISHDEERADELVKLTGRALVPVTIIGGKTIIGFDEPKLTQAIQQYKKS